MKPTAKTLQIFLPEGNPAGIRVAELTTRIVQAVAVPRTRLTEFFQREESKHIGVYFLFGGDDGSSKPIAYIGQTEDLKQRLKDHDSQKEFWSIAVVIISRTHSFTQAHIRWLEWHSIRMATEAKRYRLDNGNASSEPFVTEPIRADLEEIFETASLLIESLGFPIFEPLIEPADKSTTQENEVWRLKGLHAEATATFNSAGIIVHKGAKCRREITPSGKSTPFIAEKQAQLIDDGILVADGDSFILQEDYAFKTPSGAAAFVLARHANGWMEWKNSDGQTLKEVKRSDDDE